MDVWSCSDCTYENDADTIICQVCDKHRKKPNGSWTCNNCDQINDESTVVCQTCMTSCEGLEEMDVWSCSECTCENDADTIICQACAQHRKKPNCSWTCNNCDQINDESTVVCQNCMTPCEGFEEAYNSMEDDGRDERNDRACDIPESLSMDSISQAEGYPLEENLSILTLDQPSAASQIGSDFSQTPVWTYVAYEEESFAEAEVRLVLLGKTGHGKSSTGNCILGRQAFKSRLEFKSTTKKCQRGFTVRSGIPPTMVVDTPGLCDTQDSKESIHNEISRCLGLVTPGPNALLLMIQIGVKFTEEEYQTVKELFEIFGSNLQHYLIVVFTHGDKLSKELDFSVQVSQMIDDGPDYLQELMQSISYRYVVFNNKGDETEKDAQVKNLFEIIRIMRNENFGSYFTCEVTEKVEEHIKKKEDEAIKTISTVEVLSEEEKERIRKEVREQVRKELETEDKPSVLKEIWSAVKPLLITVASGFLISRCIVM